MGLNLLARQVLFLAIFIAPNACHAQTASASVLHQFQPSSGDYPIYGVTQGADGNLYGTTVSGGASNSGVIYKLSTDGAFTLLYEFTGGSDGGGPSSLIAGPDGSFYGTTSEGGDASCAFGCGTAFKVTSSGTLTTIHSFSNAEGFSSSSGLILASDGNFYGGAAQGGAYGDGTIYRLTLAGDVRTLYSFTGQADGASPGTPLLEASDGNFYGTTPAGTGPGTIFKMAPSGQLTSLFAYSDPEHGDFPISGLVQGSDGELYGTTSEQGASGFNNGTVFKITTSGTLTTLYTFTGGSDGGEPIGALLLASDGNFYGTTTFGGNLTGCTITSDPGCGTVYTLNPTKELKTIYTMSAATSNPTSTLAAGNNGVLYGTTDVSNVLYAISFSTPLPAPVQLTLSSSSIYQGASVTLSWKVLNANSKTLQQCYASVPTGAAGAGNWNGLQAGTVTGSTYSGSALLTPTAAGTYTYALTCGGTESGFATLTVGVAPPLKITTTSLPSGTVAVPYSATLDATGGTPPYSWSLASGELPLGLSIGPSSGTISGTPTAAGSESFNVQVEDSASTPNVASASLTLTVNAAQSAISVSPSTIKIASPGASGTSTVTVSAFSINSIAFSCSGLPAGAYCSFGTLSGSGSAGTASLQITTTSPSVTNVASSDPSPKTHQLLATLLPGVLVILAFGVGTRRRRHCWPPLKLFLMMLVIGMSWTLTACGGGNGKSSGGTPTGTSTITVTATAGSQTAAATMTLTVE